MSDVFFSTLLKIYYNDRILHVNVHPVVGSTGPKEQACSTDIGKIVHSKNEINILKFPSQKEKYVYVLSKRLVLFI